MKNQEFVDKAKNWAEGHWQLIIACLIGVIIIQQFSIIGLQSQIQEMREHEGGRPPIHLDTAFGDREKTERDETEDGQPPMLTPETGEDIRLHSNTPLLIGVIVVTIVALVGGYMWRNGVVPVGLFVWGRLRQDKSTGDITFSLKVKNRSPRAIDVSDPVINFLIRGGTRRFRANVGDLPMTLQPGTEYATTLNLNGLIRQNPELTEARGISMSVVCNEKKHTTLPNLIIFRSEEE